MSQANRRNYYRLLHVQHDAPTEVIKASYRTIMQKLKQHPDLGGDDQNASLLNEAYTTLCDAKKRTLYDRHLDATRAARNPAPSKKQKSSSNQNYGPAFCPFCQVASPGKTLGGAALSFCRVCDSPLTPIKQVIQQGDNKRAVKRTAVRGQLDFFSKWPQPSSNTGKILDLSPKGLKFAYDSKLQKNSLIKIDSKGLKAVGRIVSCLCSTNQFKPVYNIGIEFITLNFQEEKN